MVVAWPPIRMKISWAWAESAATNIAAMQPKRSSAGVAWVRGKSDGGSRRGSRRLEQFCEFTVGVALHHRPYFGREILPGL